MKALSLGLGLALLLVVPLLASAQTPDETAEFLAARANNVAARNGEAGANDRAFGQFERLSQAHPDQPLYRAYYGSTYCIKGRDAWFPFTKLSNVDSGMAQIDKALRLLGPEHDRQQINGLAVSLETRLVAASTLAGLPASFQRAQQARDVIADLLASPVFGAAPAGFKAAVYLQAGRMAQKDGAEAQAEANLRKAAEIAPDSTAGKQALELLAKPKA